MLTTYLTLLSLASLAIQAHLLDYGSEIVYPTAINPQTVTAIYPDMYSQASTSSQMLETPTTTRTDSIIWLTNAPSKTSVRTTTTSVSTNQTSAGLPKSTNSSAAAERLGSEGILAALGLMVGVGMLV
ncbi:hypothetical protein N431DRAFT_447491 [Stipitochalara longipes BDJ]|nr:hypothetical protein N431DRAFT_447491 [Stipitochalara longipes BDJ]